MKNDTFQLEHRGGCRRSARPSAPQGLSHGPPPSSELPAWPQQAPEFTKQNLVVPASSQSSKRGALEQKGTGREYGFLGFKAMSRWHSSLNSQLTVKKLKFSCQVKSFPFQNSSNRLVPSFRSSKASKTPSLKPGPVSPVSGLPSPCPQHDWRDPRERAARGRGPFCRRLAPCP